MCEQPEYIAGVDDKDAEAEAFFLHPRIAHLPLRQKTRLLAEHMAPKRTEEAPITMLIDREPLSPLEDMDRAQDEMFARLDRKPDPILQELDNGDIGDHDDARSGSKDSVKAT